MFEIATILTAIGVLATAVFTSIAIFQHRNARLAADIRANRDGSRIHFRNQSATTTARDIRVFVDGLPIEKYPATAEYFNRDSFARHHVP